MIFNIEDLRNYCLSKKGVTEELPFDDNTLVFKVAGKMFALSSIYSEQFYINLKCDPERSIQLRSAFENNIKPGYHMNKKHWNSVYIDHHFDPKITVELIDHSYDLVVSKLPKKTKELLNNME